MADLLESANLEERNGKYRILLDDLSTNSLTIKRIRIVGKGLEEVIGSFSFTKGIAGAHYYHLSYIVDALYIPSNCTSSPSYIIKGSYVDLRKGDTLEFLINNKPVGRFIVLSDSATESEGYEVERN